MSNPRDDDKGESGKVSNGDVDTGSGEFLDAAVIQEGSAARYSLALDRVTALETALRRHMEQMHNLHHVDVVHKDVKSWEECGMSSCRNVRAVLDDKWWEVQNGS